MGIADVDHLSEVSGTSIMSESNASLVRIAETLSIGKIRRHIFLCADQTNGRRVAIKVLPRSLAKDPGGRFPGAESMRAALGRFGPST